ncbi:HAD family hydrolase [Bdellovibrionota bacterium FG-1]
MKTLFQRISFLLFTTTLLCGSVLSATKNSLVLRQIIQAVESGTWAETTPLVIFDVDDTLFDSRTRTVAIMRDIAGQAEVIREYPEAARQLATVALNDIRFFHDDTMKSLGITDPAIITKFRDLWAAQFFSNLCAMDTPINGAAEYVHELADAGAQIIYLTGRDEPRMGPGTRDGLLRNGFPMDNSVQLLMKPDAKMDDLVYKTDAFRRISTMGKVIAGFENEPRNLNEMHRNFPDAIMIFLDTIHSNRPDVPTEGAVWVDGFERP